MTATYYGHHYSSTLLHNPLTKQTTHNDNVLIEVGAHDHPHSLFTHWPLKQPVKPDFPFLSAPAVHDIQDV